jgi:hypothetical protein
MQALGTRACLTFPASPPRQPAEASAEQLIKGTHWMFGSCAMSCPCAEACLLHPRCSYVTNGSTIKWLEGRAPNAPETSYDLDTVRINDMLPEVCPKRRVEGNGAQIRTKGRANLAPSRTIFPQSQMEASLVQGTWLISAFDRVYRGAV